MTRKQATLWIPAVALLAAALATPAAAYDGNLAFQFRLGGFFPSGDDRFWQDVEDTFTLSASDFNDAIVGFSFVGSFNNNFEAGFNIDSGAPARLVIGADGADSTLRGLLGIGADRHDYGQVAVICNVTPELPHGNRAFERMTRTGPFALLPHVGQRCGLVWCVPEEDAEVLLAMPQAALLEAATKRSGGALGGLTRLGRRSAYPLRRVVPERDVAGRAVLLGNAAHTIHPVGAQGFNLGLRDVATLAEVLADEALRHGERPDPGAAA